MASGISRDLTFDELSLPVVGFLDMFAVMGFLGPF